MLYILSFAKLIFPLLTLPYLTRILSEETYGLVSYVKSCMTYMHLIVDFGFMKSAVKEVAEARGSKQKLGQIVGDTIIAKIILTVVAMCTIIIMICAIDVLQTDVMYVIGSFLAVGVTAFFVDFLFMGIEKMQYITYLHILTRAVSVGMTFIVVNEDADIMWMPLLDIASNLMTVAISILILRKERIGIRVTSFGAGLIQIKKAFVYALSDFSSTAFSALNTILIGVVIKDLTVVAQWSLCFNTIATIQGLYSPISNAIYPYMIRERNLKLIHKVLIIFMPVILVGCLICFGFAKTVLLILGGEKYVGAYYILRWLVPILFISFPVQIYGWPTLGAVGREKETTATTIFAAAIQVVGLGFIIATDIFSLALLAILRIFTELILCVSRIALTYKNKAQFV